MSIFKSEPNTKSIFTLLTVHAELCLSSNTCDVMCTRFQTDTFNLQLFSEKIFSNYSQTEGARFGFFPYLELKQTRRRRQGKRHPKSEFAMSQS